MRTSRTTVTFQKLVHNKFSIYNSLFLNLPYQQDKSIGTLIPILYEQCQNGLTEEREPLDILDTFFRNYTQIKSETDKIDFLFRVIQYVERQVVLYDAVEDAAFAGLRKLEPALSFQDYFQLAESDTEQRILAERIADFSARIVFTAHPTQFYPPAILDIIDSLRKLIRENRIDDIHLTLQQLGLTSLLHAQKPTPLEEARNIVYFLRNVYYDAVGELYTRIKEQMGAQPFENYDLIKLGFWPGGDRDGNPSVTFDTTTAVLDLLQTTLMKCYHDDVKRLRKLLTFREVDDILRKLKDELYAYTLKPAEENIYSQLLDQLNAVRGLVVENFHGLYLLEIDSLVDKVKLFKTHFATLDIRQDHRVHQRVIAAILKKEGVIKQRLEELSTEELTRILLEENFPTSADDFDDELIKDTLRTISGLRSIQHQHGQEACHRYIISNSEDIFAVLCVFALFRWCGWPKDAMTFDIIPLFETMTGLAQADTVLEALLILPDYRDHLRQRQDKQTIMLGFSDGTKDGGYLQANWSIFQAKERLSAVARDWDVKVVFFDGRGGPPARGGGKTYRFYASQSPYIANHEIQLTIQGQTITSKFGTREQFIHQCEQLLTAGLFTNFPGRKNEISESARQLMAELAEISYRKYVELKNHPQFIPYLERRSPLRFYEMVNIGSRPGRRG
ncbi:MAG: phosphoenolpyruvate carboxylase, partial [Candidatus Marinimicrobia bacterium]|nr:phosphoenolpyruvate carboxylase [Candidatus Neomarinimicrobiota bacterium]